MKYPQLVYPFRLKEIDGQLKIYDVIRKDFFVLTPEEWVRQHVISLLIEEKGVAKSRIAVERQIKGSTKRFDLLIHNKESGQPFLIIECKSFKQQLQQSTLNQIGRYNMKLKVPYLVVTNWHNWIAAEVHQTEQRFSILDHFPEV